MNDDEKEIDQAEADKLADQGQDIADEAWKRGECLYCGEPNDQKEKNIRACSKCEKKGENAD